MKGTRDHRIQVYEEVAFLKGNKLVPYSFSGAELGPMCGSYVEADFRKHFENHIPIVRNL